MLLKIGMLAAISCATMSCATISTHKMSLVQDDGDLNPQPLPPIAPESAAQEA